MEDARIHGAASLPLGRGSRTYQGPMPPLRDPSPPCDQLDRPAVEHLIKAIECAVRARNYSHRTEEAYVCWIRRFIRFHDRRHPAKLGEAQVREFLNDLAVQREVSASTQNQALSALLFLYKDVLGRDVSWIRGIVRPKKPKRLPTVLSREEACAVLRELEGTRRLMTGLLYGSGLRLTECIELRVKDVDLERDHILVRAGKGDKDRVTLLPQSLKPALRRHMNRLRVLHKHDVADRVPTWIPPALARKLPSAGLEWAWAYLFPSKSRAADEITGKVYRRHVHESVLQRAVKEAVRKSGVAKRVTCHTFRHSFATHLLESGCNIRMIQKLLGHKDLRTTMVYTHVAAGNKLGVQSPIDLLSGLG